MTINLRTISFTSAESWKIHNESSRRTLKVLNPLLIYFVTMMLLKNKLTFFLLRSNLTSFLSMCAYIISSCVLIFLTHFLHFLWPSSSTFHLSLSLSLSIFDLSYLPLYVLFWTLSNSASVSLYRTSNYLLSLSS